MIVSADAFLTFDEHLVVSELASGLPDDVLQPAGARTVAPEFEILVTHQVEQNERACIRQFISFAQYRNVMTAAVSVVWTIRIVALAPAFTESFFAVEENKSVRDFRFFFVAAEHSCHLEQRCDR